MTDPNLWPVCINHYGDILCDRGASCHIVLVNADDNNVDLTVDAIRSAIIRHQETCRYEVRNEQRPNDF